MRFSTSGFREPPEYEPLPQGDYKFVVAQCKGIKQTKKGYEMVTLVISVKKREISAYLYEGTNEKGKHFDFISPFLKAIGEAPTGAEAADPVYWESLVGKKGRVHIKCEKYDDRVRNAVAHFIYPEPTPPAYDPDIVPF